jgi:hypothetical protein
LMLGPHRALSQFQQQIGPSITSNRRPVDYHTGAVGATLGAHHLFRFRSCQNCQRSSVTPPCPLFRAPPRAFPHGRLRRKTSRIP